MSSNLKTYILKNYNDYKSKFNNIKTYFPIPKKFTLTNYMRLLTDIYPKIILLISLSLLLKLKILKIFIVNLKN